MTQAPPTSSHLVLDPVYGRDAARYYLRTPLEAGRELVGYGADLLLRCFQTMDRSLANGMVLGVLFRQSIAALDGFMLCLENGAVDAAGVHSRGALEASLYIRVRPEARKRGVGEEDMGLLPPAEPQLGPAHDPRSAGAGSIPGRAQTDGCSTAGAFAG